MRPAAALAVLAAVVAAPVDVPPLVEVNPAGADPTVVDDLFTVRPDQAAVVDPLANDTLMAGDAVDTFDTISANNGQITFNPATQTFTYLPAPGFRGVDFFTYTVCNSAGAACQTGTVEVDVFTTVTTPPGVWQLLLNGQSVPIAECGIEISITVDVEDPNPAPSGNVDYLAASPSGPPVGLEGGLWLSRQAFAQAGGAASQITVNSTGPIQGFSLGFQAQQAEEVITFSVPATSVEGEINSTFGLAPAVISTVALANGNTELTTPMTGPSGSLASAAFGANSRVTWDLSANPITSISIGHSGPNLVAGGLTDPGTGAPIATTYNGTIVTDDVEISCLPEEIAASKSAGAPAAAPTAGNFLVPYSIVVKNNSEVPLSSLSLLDDFATQIGPAFVGVTAGPAVVDRGATSNPAPNPGWNGTGDLLVGSPADVLDVGETYEVTFTAELNPGAPGAASPFVNQATAIGLDPLGSPVTDLTDSGTDPDTPNPGAPGDTGGRDDPTPVVLSTAEIDVVKAATSAPAASGTSGNFDITYDFTVTNTGASPLTNLSLTDDASAELGAAFVAIAEAPAVTPGTATTPPSPNAAYSGTGDLLVGAATDDLQPGQSFTVRLVVEVNPNAPGAVNPLTNVATATGDDPFGTPVSDDGDATTGVPLQLCTTVPTPVDIVFLVDNGSDVDDATFDAATGLFTGIFSSVFQAGGSIRGSVVHYGEPTVGARAGSGDLFHIDGDLTDDPSFLSHLPRRFTSAEVPRDNIPGAVALLQDALNGTPNANIVSPVTSLTRTPGARLAVVLFTASARDLPASHAIDFGNLADPFGYMNAFKTAEDASVTVIRLPVPGGGVLDSDAQGALAALASVGGQFTGTVEANPGDPEGSGTTPRRLFEGGDPMLAAQLANQIAVDLCTEPADPALTLDKRVQGGAPAAPTIGDLITYEYELTNTGNVVLDVSVADALPGLSAVVCPVTRLVGTGDSTICTATYRITAADAAAGQVVNTATATGVPDTGPPVTTPPDSVTIVIPPAPALAINKSIAGGPPADLVAGVVLTYQFAVTNTGNVPLTGIVVNDPLVGLSPIVCPVTALAAGASTTCTATYTVTQADVDAGVLPNTATASGTPPTSPQVDSPPDDENVTGNQAPAIDLLKAATGPGPTRAGDVQTYAYDVSNVGNVTLTGVTVNDPLPGLSAVTCPVTTLAAGSSTRCTATYTVTQADVDNGRIDNTATATGVPPTGPAVSSPPRSVTVFLLGVPALTIDKSFAGGPPADLVLGARLDYRYLVTNTGNLTLTDVTVNDPLPGLSAVTCPVNTLAPGDTTTCAASYTVTQADVDASVLPNTATATGTPPSGTPVDSPPDSENVPGTPVPSIRVVKSVQGPPPTVPGDVVTYAFEVTNTGNVTLRDVAVSDSLAGLSAIACPVVTLAPGASTICTATYTVTPTDVDGGRIDNTATATGVPPTGPPVTSPPDDEIVVIPPSPSLSINKSIAGGPPADLVLGNRLTYQYLVANTGNLTLTDVAVVDPLPGLSAVTCATTTLVAGASTTCSATYTVTQADVDAGTLTNTASATGVPPTGPPISSPPDSEMVPGVPTPSLALAKRATGAAPVRPGDVIVYEFVATNTGNVTLTNVAVSDPLPGLSAITCPVTTLAAGASVTCTATYATTQVDVDGGQIDNTATATGVPPTGPPVDSPPADETVVIPPSPALSINKSIAGGPPADLVAGTVLEYRYVATNTGNVTLSDVRVDDPLAGLSAVTCPITTLAAGEFTTCSATYTVTQADVDAGSLPNTATATGTPPTGPPTTSPPDSENVPGTPTPAISVVKSLQGAPPAEPGDVITYGFLVTNTGNVTLTGVSVADPLPGLSAIECPASTLAPGGSTTCTATYTVTQADVDAGQIANTAMARGTPPTGPPVDSPPSDETVTVPPRPLLSINKSVQGGVPQTIAVGDLVTYDFVVTNVGNVTLTGVAVVDPLPGLSAVTCPATTLVAGASTTCSATYTITQADVDATTVVNVATATGVPPVGPPVTSPPDDETVPGEPVPALTIVKTADETAPAIANVGDLVTFTFDVTNTGNVSLSGVTVADPLPGLSPVTCAATDLAPGAATACTATYAITQADLDAGSITNTATATGTPPIGPPVTSPPDTVVIDLPPAPNPRIGVAKAVTDGPTVGDDGRSTLTYTIDVVNAGDVPLAEVQVADDLAATFAGAAGFEVVSVVSNELAVNPGYDGRGDTALLAGTDTLPAGLGASIRLTVTVDPGGEVGPYLNTAVGTGVPPDGNEVTDDSDSGVFGCDVAAASPGTVSPAQVACPNGDPDDPHPDQPGDTGGVDDPTPVLFQTRTPQTGADSAVTGLAGAIVAVLGLILLTAAPLARRRLRPGR